jgi:adenylylsulfate kinase-like enzyme
MLSWTKGKAIAIVQGGSYNGKVLRVDTTYDPKEHIVEDKDKYGYGASKSKPVKGKGRKQRSRKFDSDSEDSEDSYLFDEEPEYGRKKRITNEYMAHISLNDGHFVPCPDDNKYTSPTRQSLYIAGPSGSGKSTYTMNYLTNFKKLFPKKDIMILSRVANDETIKKYNNKLKLGIKKIDVDETLIEDPIVPETFFKNGACVIFDDISTIKEKKIREEVLHLRDDLLEVGRHNNVYVISTNHQLMDYRNTRTLLNEADFITFFPAGAKYHATRFLKVYCGLDSAMIKRILCLPTRWVTISMKYPQMCFSETQAFMLK